MVKRFSRAVILGLSALLGLLSVMGFLSRQAVAQNHSCAPWPELEHPALQVMQTCYALPIQRLLGDVCTEVQWLCGDLTIEAWIDQLMTNSTDEWIVHRLDQGLVFAQWPAHGHSSTSLFWSPESSPSLSNQSGVRIMVSRLRARPGNLFKPLLR